MSVPNESITTEANEHGVRLRRTVDRASRRIAPLWPLRHFVAVNPFLGLADQSFADAAKIMGRVAGARTTIPRQLVAEALRQGRVTHADLDAALGEVSPTPGAPDGAEALAAFASCSAPSATIERAATVADTARSVTGSDWERFVTESISRWAASYFDEGQALWSSPWGELAPFAAWRAEASLDRSPEIAGIAGFREIVGRLPESAPEAIEAMLERLGVPEAGLELYLQRLLMSIGGWAAFARHQVWESELYGRSDATLAELLAIRLAWELALLEAFADSGLGSLWQTRREGLASREISKASEAELTGELALQIAFERAVQRELVSKLAGGGAAAREERSRVQAVFCIDVRSEVFRRALEFAAPGIETLGFAGFFGFPIEYVPLGSERGGAQCPVLLTPQIVVEESIADAGEDELRHAREQRERRRRVARAWQSFKLGAVSCFGFVGPVGLSYLPKLLRDSFGLGRPVEDPAGWGLDPDVRARIAPRLEPGLVAGRETGLPIEQRIAMAEGVLRAMSLSHDFARLILLVGHGSTTVNNPHATGLDCGACGGHTGEANARVAAAVLGDPAVREGLRARGIELPEDTVFLAAQHDTTTDEVTIFDEARIPESHRRDLADLHEALREAGRRTRAERSRLLGLEPGPGVDAAILERSRDWSQVRPEWGLAGCAAFIAAPRHRTRDVDLAGRSFLHSYEWREDEGFGVLELIMTAPMVVASWISLQYFGSSVDNRVFGSGNKVLHNVVGTLGVLEGNGGDLRVGLPWQSVHDGEKLIHEPVRLNVMIEAPIEAMDAVLEKHPEVRELLDHGWLHLFAIDEQGRVDRRYAGERTWVEVAI